MKIDLHLVSWNRPKMTDLVIRTIARNTKSANYRLVVLDNGSNDSQQKRLFELHDNGLIDELVLLRWNIGLEPARQKMLMESTRSEYFICVDNDCLPPPMEDGQDWIERLVELMQKYEDFAAISARTQVMIGTGNIFADADEVGDEIVEFPHPGGSFRIMRTKAVQEVGGWDREEKGRGAEERYICGKLRDAGYRTAFAAKVECLHLFGDRNQTSERWGYKDGMTPSQTGHTEIDHPALRNGDSLDQVSFFSGDSLAGEYFNVDSSN